MSKDLKKQLRIKTQELDDRYVCIEDYKRVFNIPCYNIATVLNASEDWGLHNSEFAFVYGFSKESNEKYCEDHKYHCFRCGTKSLVEVDRGDVKIDICANEKCGAVHLDPGELEDILKDEKSILTIRKTLFAVFKSSN